MNHLGAYQLFMYFIEIQDLECVGFFTTHIFYLVAPGFRVVGQAATDKWNKLCTWKQTPPVAKTEHTGFGIEQWATAVP